MSIEIRAAAQVRRAQEAITDAVKDIGSSAALSCLADVQIAASSLISALAHQAMEASLQQERRPNSADVDAALKAAGYGGMEETNGMAETKPSPYDRALDFVRQNAKKDATNELDRYANSAKFYAKSMSDPIGKPVHFEASESDRKAYVDSQVAEAERRFVNALVKLAE